MGRNRLPRETLEKVAYYCSTGVEQQEIARRLEIGQSTVSRLLKQAFDDGLLSQSPPLLDPTKVDFAKLLRDEKGAELEACMAEASDQTLRELFIMDVEVGSDRHQRATEQRHLAELEQFGRMAAQCFRDYLLPKAENVGVTWGHTLMYLVSSFSRIGEVARKDVKFLQMCGEPAETAQRPETRSSHLIAQLNQAFRHESDSVYTFNLPACISRQIRSTELPTVKKFIQTVDSYRLLFGESADDSDALVNQMDCLLTSCGTNDDTDLLLTTVADAMERDVDELCKRTVGNIAGIWIEKRGNSRLINELAERWIGISRAQFDLFIDRAKSEKKTGSIVVAAGAHKAEIVKTVVEKGFVMRLIIDQTLWRELSLRYGINIDET